MKISVIIPIYNGEKFLQKCMDCVLGQSRKADEIILVDDGSKDGSGRLCDEYARGDASVSVIHQENKGLGAARNAGIERMTGDYVAFLDVDDEIASDYIQKYCEEIEKTGCDTCKGTYQRIDQNGNYLFTCHVEPRTYRDEEVLTCCLPQMIGSAPDKKDSIPASAWANFYSVKIIKENKLTYLEERKWIAEDVMFNVVYMGFAKHVVQMDYPGYLYRVTDGSLTNIYRTDRIDNYMSIYQWEKEQITRLGVFEECRFRMSRQLFVWVRMVFFQLNKKICQMAPKDIRKELKRICSNEQLLELIDEFPVKKMGIPQQAFLYMIKYKMVWGLYLAFCVR